MKKLLAILFFALGSSLFTQSNAQYIVLHNFNDTLGAYPAGALTFSGKTIYGMTDEGGIYSMGCIFSMDTTGANYFDILDFNGTNGAYPEGGTLKLLNGKLFGMTTGGGANDSGCVFSVNTNGTGYKDLLDFNGTNGAEPWGSLVLSGSKMFGMTLTGGASIAGNIFTIDTAGNNYKNLYSFTGVDGQNPYGDVTIIGGKLYGLTSYGGGSGYGTIFSIDSNGSGIADLYDFPGATGEYPNNLLTYSGTQFFGVANSGGGYGYGNVFSVDTNGTSFDDILDFNGTTLPDGEYPLGDVILSGQVLFGMTSGGGATDSGCIYSVDTNGSNYKDLYDFNTASGDFPVSNVSKSGPYLYGTTNYGGTNLYGTIFKLDYTTVGIKNIKNSASVKLYPNPSTGIFNFTIRNYQLGITNDVEVFNTLGEEVYSQSLIPNSQFLINLSTQPNGIYLYRVLTETGNLVGEGKLVIQK